MDTKKVSGKLLAVIFLVLVVVMVSFIVFSQVLSKKGKPSTLPTNSILNQDEGIIPTVDASVRVSLAKDEAGKDVSLTLDGIPSGTQSIDYELSYEEKTKGLQGAIGTITVNEGENTFKKQITLGTCSSGRCVYHEVVGKVKVTLKFTGSYGDKLFEKEYAI